MIQLTELLKDVTAIALSTLFPKNDFDKNNILINETKPEFEGDYTIVLFPFVKSLKTNPEELGNNLGDVLVRENKFITGYQVIKGFLNVSIADDYWLQFLNNQFTNLEFGKSQEPSQKIMVEYSSPNTNKPLHFGHLRNNFLGWSVAEILKYTGNTVIKANLINDRGIHICKSMIAWMRYGNEVTPQSSGIKGDHLVGDYYVKFNDVYNEEIAEMVAKGIDKEIAKKEAPIMLAAQDLLLKWEQGDKDVYDLWKKMNAWVYEGFDKSYAALGIDFDKMYYESETYLLGKQLVEQGLEKGVLYKKENGSVWIDLTEDGLDEKLLLRADGTSVYMTQDLGTAQLKYNDYNLDKSIYVIADEQNYHMQVLQLILKKLGEPCADGIYHLSYGMVELPTGRMKSREGTVVDADDMISEMIELAKAQTEAAGKTEGFTEEELNQLYKTIGLGALKFFLLKIEPKKKMIFNPSESIDLHGFTATFIQYAHARIASIMRKNDGWNANVSNTQLSTNLSTLEKQLIKLLEQYPQIIQEAAQNLNPAVICNYLFKLAQTFNSFFDKHTIIRAENEEIKLIRLKIAQMVKNTISSGMNLLGINVPERM